MNVSEFIKRYQTALDEALAEYEKGTDEHIDEFHRTHLQELFAAGIEFGSKETEAQKPVTLTPNTPWKPRGPIEYPDITYGNGTE